MKKARELARDDLIAVLTGRSGDAVNWLQDKFGLDLSQIARLGGHNQPRTHRGGAQFPGMVRFIVVKAVQYSNASCTGHYLRSDGAPGGSRRLRSQPSQDQDEGPCLQASQGRVRRCHWC